MIALCWTNYVHLVTAEWALRRNVTLLEGEYFVVYEKYARRMICEERNDYFA